MAEGTKAEIIVVGAALAVILWLWHANRNAGGGTGTTVLPLFAGGGTAPGLTTHALPGAAPLFDVPAPVPGSLFSYQASPYNAPGWNLPSPLSYGDGTGTEGSCNTCGGGQGQRAATFGSQADLSAWLTAAPDVMTDARSGLSAWY